MKKLTLVLDLVSLIGVLLMSVWITTPAMAAQPEFALARYNPNGGLDKTFGIAGRQLTTFATTATWVGATALAVDPATHRLVAAGSVSYGSGAQFAVARYNPNGRLDPTFGSGGRVLTAFPNASAAEIRALTADWATGKLVAAGVANFGGSVQFALVRYNPDGNLDTTFGSGGRVLTTFTNALWAQATALAADPTTGKLVAAGYAWDGSFCLFALARYNVDGSLDTTFGTGGGVLTRFSTITTVGSGAVAKALAVDWATGNLVAAGYTFDNNSGSVQFALARYNVDGSLDTTFGTGGRVLTTFPSTYAPWAVAYALTADWASGKLVAAGQAFDGSANQFGLVRYNPDGSLDTTFGSGGRVLTRFSGATGAIAFALAPDPAVGKLVAAGIASQ